jgi:large subunit ribosomal protein L17
MLANLATSILDKERIRTTLVKAKEVRGVVERLVTYGKRGGLHGVRLAARVVRSKDVLKKLVDDIAPGYKEREGGYVRIVRTGERPGDNAAMCIVELVGRGEDVQRTRKKKGPARRRRAKKAGAPVDDTAVAPEEPAEVEGASQPGESGDTDDGVKAKPKKAGGVAETRPVRRKPKRTGKKKAE